MGEPPVDFGASVTFHIGYGIYSDTVVMAVILALLCPIVGAC